MKIFLKKSILCIVDLNRVVLRTLTQIITLLGYEVLDVLV